MKPLFIAKLTLLIAAGVAVGACTTLNPNTEAQILSALDAQKSAFQACYQSALNSDRETQGAMTLKLQIDQESGKVTNAAVTSSDIRTPNMDTCVTSAASGITLPEPPGMPVEGSYDIQFSYDPAAQ